MEFAELGAHRRIEALHAQRGGENVTYRVAASDLACMSIGSMTAAAPPDQPFSPRTN